MKFIFQGTVNEVHALGGQFGRRWWAAHLDDPCSVSVMYIEGLRADEMAQLATNPNVARFPKSDNDTLNNKAVGLLSKHGILPGNTRRQALTYLNTNRVGGAHPLLDPDLYLD